MLNSTLCIDCQRCMYIFFVRQDEIILMRQLNHPNVLPVLSSFVSGHEIVSVLPVMGYGSCAHLILRYFPAGLPEAAIAIILKAVLNALHYLHSKGIIHR